MPTPPPTAPQARAQAQASAASTHAQRRLGLQALTEADLDTVLEAEKRAYAHPWSLRNFRDSLDAGYPAQLLVTPPLPGDTPHRLTTSGHMLLSYWVAMAVLDEVHVLNIAVLPEHRRQGWGHTLLQALATHALAQQAQCLWLEVRAGNAPARALYGQFGFVPVGVRKQYYPADQGLREDAIVMTLNLLTLNPLGHTPPATPTTLAA